MPDVITLVQLSELFGITVNELLNDPNRLPETTGAVVEKMEKAVEKTLKRKADKLSILGLSSLLVWSVALLLFVIISSLDIPRSWIAFIYAIPANAIVLLSLLSAWRDFRWNKTLVSILVWGGILSIYVSLLMFVSFNIWKLFLMGIPGQLAVLLWFRLFRKPAKEEQNG
jgi:cation transport ATPase